MNLIETTIGIDPGIGGSIAALIGDSPVVWDVPVVKSQTVRKKKKVNKSDYDLEGMVNILKHFEGQEVICALEKVSARPGEGVVSSFGFGKGYGYWKGIVIAYHFTLIEVTPTIWKKYYPEITECDEISSIRKDVVKTKEEIKALDAKASVLVDKTQKKALQEDIKKRKSEIERNGREIKSIAKTKARELASKLYPHISDSFKLVKDADRAEALLIAKFARENINELV